MDLTGIIQEKDGSYSYRVKKVLPSGEKIDTKKRGFTTKTEAKQARNLRLAEIANLRTKYVKKRIRIDDLHSEFIATEAKNNRKYSTILRYESLHKNYISPTFGSRWADTINQGEVNKFLLNLKIQGKSIAYIQSFAKQLNTLFKYALQNGYLDDNPLLNMEPMRKEIALEHEKLQVNKVFSDQQIQMMIKRLEHSANLTPFLLGYYMGLRVSEAYALRWEDVDFEKQTLQVDKQMQYQDYQWCLIPPKSFKSYRLLDIPKPLIEHLKTKLQQEQSFKEHYNKAYQTNNIRLKLKPGQDKMVVIPDFICVKPKGEMLTPGSSKVITNMAKEIGIENYRFHYLRHTHASILANSNISVMLLRERMGHEKVETTWGFYSHITNDAREQLNNTLNNFI